MAGAPYSLSCGRRWKLGRATALCYTRQDFPGWVGGGWLRRVENKATAHHSWGLGLVELGNSPSKLSAEPQHSVRLGKTFLVGWVVRKAGNKANLSQLEPKIG